MRIAAATLVSTLALAPLALAAANARQPPQAVPEPYAGGWLMLGIPPPGRPDEGLAAHPRPVHMDWARLACIADGKGAWRDCRVLAVSRPDPDIAGPAMAFLAEPQGVHPAPPFSRAGAEVTIQVTYDQDIAGNLSLQVSMTLDGSAPPAPPGPPPRPPPRPSVRTNPDWLVKPTADDLGRYFPEAAQRAGVGGKATIQCKVAITTLLTDCVVVSESPEGYGFGDAALKVAGVLRMKPAAINGKPFDGAIIRIPLNFGTPPPMPPPPGPTDNPAPVPEPARPHP